jgi:phosphate-selective porin OprO/OprP
MRNQKCKEPATDTRIFVQTQRKFSILVIDFASCFLILSADGRVLADSPQTKSMDSYYKALSERVEKGIRGPISGWRYYRKDGYFSIDSRKENIKFRITGQILVDGGDIDADEELQNSFPDLDGSNILFRKLSVSTYGNFYDTVDFKIGIDFANAKDVQDIWIRYLKNPLLKKIKFGNQKEPLSLEYLTSISRVTFMERALPDVAFGLGRNIGIRYDSLNPEKRINFGAGVFLNTGSFSKVGEGADQISEANGFDVTARVFGLPVYDENGEKMLHLGLGYSYGSRNEDDLDASMRLRTRPESRLTDDRLVDTGPILGKRRDMANAELAMVFGPWSFQGQCYYTSLNANAANDPDFWGYYAFLSYFITGEHRNYNRSIGVFTGVEPQPVFHPMKGDWGAWELALRHSYVDLNDGIIKGGKESNFTAGLNWIHNRNVRLMFNYIHAYVKDRASPSVENGRAHIFQVRFQFIM